jgi:predicted nucleotidyltransferase
MLHNILEKFKGKSQTFIYGSFAKGEEREGSDIDLLIIGEVDEDKLIEEVGRLERKLQREINYAIYGKEDFNKKKKEGNFFILDILKEKKIFLIGDENGL